MTNTSATGGALLPAAAPAPLEGQALDRFLQQWVVGILGVDGSLVRPRWQAEPSNIPTEFTAWVAMGVTRRPSDTYPYVKHSSDGDHLQRHEDLHILFSFYDTGVDGKADTLGALLRDGLSIPQNLELLTENNMGFVSCGEQVPAPVLLNERWLYRFDMEVVVRREVERIYPVGDIESASGTILRDDGAPPVPFSSP